MIIYDLETANPIDDKRTPRRDGINYANGWSDFKGMGIACVCCYDFRTNRTRVFSKDNLGQLALLFGDTECVVGFNNYRFDDLLLKWHGVIFDGKKSYDILHEIYRSLGVLNQQYKPKGYTLGNIARTNFGIGKTGSGADAPFEWQEGNIGTVIDYCLYDVHLTYKLLDRIMRCGYIFDPNNPKNKIHLRKPGSFFAEAV